MKFQEESKMAGGNSSIVPWSADEIVHDWRNELIGASLSPSPSLKEEENSRGRTICDRWIKKRAKSAKSFRPRNGFTRETPRLGRWNVTSPDSGLGNTKEGNRCSFLPPIRIPRYRPVSPSLPSIPFVVFRASRSPDLDALLPYYRRISFHRSILDGKMYSPI